ncbi:Uma2 family endonuclease [Aquisphaera insulae]|uniref:Uma2 family endonuclease n=1 Tax=Aquisphaera insulae TaxID=2712864 RepID=UPI0013EA054C|nr:Uma2 family endonuclease [Aquisphaera insulae]
MSTIPPTAASLDDLDRVDGKAELIGGRIIPIRPTGRRPNLVAGRIYRSLAGYTDILRRGDAYTDNMGFAVAELSSGRQSFSPDVAYYDGPLPRNSMRFVDGPPTFAVEVRGEGDFGPSAEAEMAAKRADYFEAGTLIVWDVDPVDDCIRVFRADAPDNPDAFHSGEEADAEPAVPGWRMAVDWAFDVTG